MQKKSLMQRVKYLFPRAAKQYIKDIPDRIQYWKELKQYNAMANDHWKADKKFLFPILSDKKASAGSVDFHYFYQDMWAAAKIIKRNPVRHIDIGSRVDGLISHLVLHRPVDMVDIRPLGYAVPNLNFVQDDATTMSSFSDNSVESLSTLHAAEHFGLGRYGDPIDPAAPEKFCKSLQRVLKPGGHLYFSTPCGKNERVHFNAHRIFHASTILKYFNGLKLLSFSYVDDAGNFIENASLEQIENCNYACGMFEFTKE